MSPAHGFIHLLDALAAVFFFLGGGLPVGQRLSHVLPAFLT